MLAQKCNFGDTLDNMLRDRLVCGVNCDQIQRRLLSEAKLTFARAMEMAQSLEAATKNVEELQGQQSKTEKTGGDTKEQVYRMQGRGTSGCDKKPQRRSLSGKSCYRCEKDNHLAAQCPFMESVCHNCGKKGHPKRVCRSKKTPNAKDAM